MNAPTNTPILVTGGTGTLGQHVVARLRRAGHRVRVLSRRAHEASEGIEFYKGDLAADEGIEPAVQGTGIVIHCAGTRRGDEEKTRHLLRSAVRADVRHFVYISVVGADAIPVESRIDRALFGYFGAKLAAERLVAESGLPWTTLRATQFHDLILETMQEMARLPIVPVPAGFRFQPIDANEVAARLVELAVETPAGLVAPIAGPRVYELRELIRGYLWAARKHRPTVPVWIPGQAARAMRAGANLAPDHAVGRAKWEEFLKARLKTPEAEELVRLGGRGALPVRSGRGAVRAER